MVQLIRQMAVALKFAFDTTSVKASNVRGTTGPSLLRFQIALFRLAKIFCAWLVPIRETKATCKIRPATDATYSHSAPAVLHRDDCIDVDTTISMAQTCSRT